MLELADGEFDYRDVLGETRRGRWQLDATGIVVGGAWWHPPRRDRMTYFAGAQRVGVAIDLQPGDAQARYAVGVDRALPGEELLDRQMIAPARLLQAQRAVAHRGDDDRLAPHDPALGIGGGKVERAAATAAAPSKGFHSSHCFEQ